MVTLRTRLCGVVLGAATVLASGTAFAKRHTVSRGETLARIGRVYGCTVAELQRANQIETSMIREGRELVIPDECKGPVHRVAAIETDHPRIRDTDPPRPRRAHKEIAIVPVIGQSIGAPWDGELHDATRLRLGEGFHIRRPARAWGASHAVGQVERALQAVRDRFPGAHTLAIGDMSAREGGSLTEHHSHQSGRDIDIGFYFTRVPSGYPDSFITANEDLDLRKTWTLIQQFARTADQDTGVLKIYLDFKVQGRLYKWALDHDVPRGYLDDLFQYPHGRGASEGLIRHEPNHDDHFHVRFKCAPGDDECH